MKTKTKQWNETHNNGDATNKNPINVEQWQTKPSADAASVMVHVIHGEHPAAMSYGNSSASSLFFQSIFGAFFRRNRNTDTIGYHQLQHSIGNGDDDGDYDDDNDSGNSHGQKFINDIATDDYRSIVPSERRLNRAVGRDAATSAVAKQKYRLHTDCSDKTSTITTMLAKRVHQVYELLSGQLHIIIHTIYKQFPNTILCWLFHYIVGTVSIHLLLATNSS